MMRLHWTQNLDIETLEARGHLATMEELLEVVTFGLPCYENTVKLCKTNQDELNPWDLTFATKFVAICTFSSRWKGCTPWLTSIWQWTWWKQRRQTGLSSITKSSRLRKSRGLTPWFWLTDGYITFVRPLFKPQCGFVLVTRMAANSKLGYVMSKLVFDTIGKYIYLTRHRQIVETQSLNRDVPTNSEQQNLSEGQKHSLAVAKVQYQNNRLREVAVKAHQCLQKLQGARRSQADNGVDSRFGDSTSSLDASEAITESHGITCAGWLFEDCVFTTTAVELALPVFLISLSPYGVAARPQ